MPRSTLATALAPSMLVLALACEAPARSGARTTASSPNLPPNEREVKDPARSPQVEPGIVRPAPRAPGSTDEPKPPPPKIPGSAPDGSSRDAPREPGSSAVGDRTAKPPGDRGR